MRFSYITYNLIGKRNKRNSVSLAQLVGYCIIYAESQSLNLGHPTYPP
jgi:hypothetical protein